jgi:D-glycero-D-manno-heptose 1,7-bisphosphate phosphatase
VKKRAVFIDRDGTLNEDSGYPGDFEKIRIYPESFEAVRRLNRAGLLAVVVTNQSGVGRGLFGEADVALVHEKMLAAFAARGARLDAIYYCPHYAASANPAYAIACDCRKPSPGLALRASSDLGIDLGHSYVIGDKADDVAFGLNIGATPVLVLTGEGPRARETLLERGQTPGHVASNILSAARWIIRRERRVP